MEKAGIFCGSCPIRTHCERSVEQLPVNLGAATPVSVDTARHLLGHNVEAVRYATVNADGLVVPEATIVTAAELLPSQVENAFKECVSPAPNTIKVLGMRFTFGRACMGLYALDEGIHWDNAQAIIREQS
ncbi:MAG: hypothetical protein QFB87_03345 [Patescibacteria group bacterium]|nr:hypothetical protein [Patescibacteria group bacterium]